jgi:hypothetical protein
MQRRALTRHSKRSRDRRLNSRFRSKVWNQVQVQTELLMAVENTIIRLSGLSANLSGERRRWTDQSLRCPRSSQLYYRYFIFRQSYLFQLFLCSAILSDLI